MSKRAILSFDVGTKNLAYCLLDENEIIKDWNVVDIGAATYDRQCQKLIEALDKVDYGSCYDTDTQQSVTVVIERQPSINPKMRVISGQIQMYYAIEKISGGNGNTKIEKIVYYSPKFKLRCYQIMPDDDPIIEKKYSTPYAYRKNLAKQHCSIIIKRNQDEKWINLFNSTKKKDDFSDSFLQGLAYLRGI